MARPTLSKRKGVLVALLVGLGIVGAQSVAPSSAVASSVSRAVVAHPTAKAFSWLRPGDAGERVRKVQAVLKKRGFKVTVDAKFGPLTRVAVRKFQKKHHLRVTGTVGPQTWHALGLDKPTDTTTTTISTTTVAAGAYKHPNPNVERWHTVAIGIGWAEKDWKHLSCVMQRESRGNPMAQNPSTAMGLLQILYRAHKAWIGPDSSVLLDGPTNLRFGLKMFKAVGWRPWSGSLTICG